MAIHAKLLIVKFPLCGLAICGKKDVNSADIRIIMTTFAPKNRGISKRLSAGKKFPPELSRSANLDYLFATEGSMQFSGSTGSPQAYATLPRASAASAQAISRNERPYKVLMDVVVCGRIKKQWGIMVYA